MAASDIATVFFDLGDTLGTPVLSSSPVRLVDFHVFPFVPRMLEQLRSRGLRLGIISNTGADTGSVVDAVLANAGILSAFDAPLRIYSADVGLTKDTAEIFELAAERAGTVSAPARCLFVGEDSQERATAVSAGLQVCPHPVLVLEVIDGEALRFVRISAPHEIAVAVFHVVLRGRSVVPLHVTGEGGRIVFAITSGRIAAELINRGLSVDLLGGPGLPNTTEAFLLRDDMAKASGQRSASGHAQMFLTSDANAALLVSATPEGLVVALPPERSLGALHLEQARHGHTLKLIPDPLLLAAPDANPAAHAFSTVFDRVSFALPTLSPSDRNALLEITASTILGRISRYSGESDIGGTSPARLRSRHVSHQDNARAVEAFTSEFESIGQGRLTVRQQRFSHRGRTLCNVEAELTGATPDVVLVTAHLDSTAANTRDFDETSDPAPGADDDASGVAAVLTIAECFVAMSAAAPPARTIRFILFNAEEEGLVGSRVYARQQRSIDAPIVAVFQMDMIGFNSAPPRSWEVHAGFATSPEVEGRSVTLAKLIQRMTPLVSPGLEVPELFRTNGDPNRDPAAGRSDHASFHAHGYAACVASEDFFVGPDQTGPEAPDENPNYHSKDDAISGIDAAFAADIARCVAAASWIAAQSDIQGFTGRTPISPSEARMASRSEREVDSRRQADARTVLRRLAPSSSTPTAAPPSVFGGPATAPPAAVPATRINALTGTPAIVRADAPVPRPEGDARPPDMPVAIPPAATGNLVDRALAFVRAQRGNLGFASTEIDEFVPDPVVQRTSSGSAAVHLHQTYRGIPVFQMTRTVRFSPQSEVVDAAGDNAPLPPGIDIEPKIDAVTAVRKAADHLARTGNNQMSVDRFGQTHRTPTIDITGFEPRVLSALPLPARPTILERGPFENAIPGHLLIFNQPQSRLAWQFVLTFPDYAEQYTVIVSADEAAGEILYSKSTLFHALARGKVFEFSPGVADRKLIDFPRGLEDFPVMPTTPLANFPADWIEQSQTMGNTARATLNNTTTTLDGVLQDSHVVFDPNAADGDDQKVLNIFYFCNYMHDFLFILGFDEAAGNFQFVNFTHTGLGGDPVRARAHSGPVFGTANMSRSVDGQPPVMNMGLVASTGRHTAFDADVVFHEYTHGLTGRLVGGGMSTHALDEPQSAGMNEGWADFFALTVQNFFRPQEKVVTGDWVVDNPAGIRTAPYDENYPLSYGRMGGLDDEHQVGELWCAALMLMTRRIRRALGSDKDGYRIAWQIVVDGLKLTQANPTFLDARDAILRALDELKSQGRVSPAAHKLVRRASWEAFAHFGMGANAFSVDAGLEGITEDHSIPAGL